MGHEEGGPRRPSARLAPKGTLSWEAVLDPVTQVKSSSSSMIIKRGMSMAVAKVSWRGGFGLGLDGRVDF